MPIATHPKFLILNQCKTFQQLKQAHAQTITQRLISLNPSFVLAKILYFLTVLNAPSSPSIHYADSIFNQIPTPSTFAYNTIIRAHTLLSSPQSALLLFVEMRRLYLLPDFHTYPFVLKTCARLATPSTARSVHSQALKFGFGDHIYVTNALIHAYSDSDLMDEASQVFDEARQRDIVSYNTLIARYVRAWEVDIACAIFDEMPVRDSVSWGTLLVGYTQVGRCNEGIQLFDEMLDLGVRPDNVALVGAISACAQLGMLDKGMAIHDHIRRIGILPNVFLSTGVVDMYAKCGCIGIAMDIFKSSHDKNIFTWNAMIAGLAMHGHGQRSLELFIKMQDMESIYNVRRGLSHYGCMADLLRWAGLIEEAVEMIESMPMEGDVYVWGSARGGARYMGMLRWLRLLLGT
ncbi:pentatricopeptide repeat-containing protein At5g61800-like [Magnolia sinica]|uniref:pentatricopeptide repeat-containing protein At5g61800-like n=1 Tax=Magnolia sinica TaxID=86752 RepID=UPI002657C8A0|nr:pentatricopeptide repeat-containing protein At5g61800-like [Magnolia sinica]